MPATPPEAPATRSTPVTDPTDWQRLPTADSIALRDPLAETLGMVRDEDPIVVTFPDVAKAAGHACPAVAGAYRVTQVALASLYPDPARLPVRGEIAVRVGGSRDDHGVGPMASIVEHITGAADETGFAGLGGIGGRQDLLSFGSVDGPGPGRAFAFTRTDTDATVRVSFDPQAGGGMADLVPELVGQDRDATDREDVLAEWHRRVQRVLDLDPSPDGPLVLERD